MHRHFENWNDMKHEPRKFWLTATTFFNLCKIIHIHDGESESQTPLFRLLGGGGGSTQAGFSTTSLLRTSTPTISVKFTWHIHYINKNRYQKFRSKGSEKVFSYRLSLKNVISVVLCNVSYEKFVTAQCAFFWPKISKLYKTGPGETQTLKLTSRSPDRYKIYYV